MGEPTCSIGLSSIILFRSLSLIILLSKSHKHPSLSTVMRSSEKQSISRGSGMSLIAAATRGGEYISDRTLLAARCRSRGYLWPFPPRDRITAMISSSSSAISALTSWSSLKKLLKVCLRLVVNCVDVHSEPCWPRILGDAPLEVMSFAST